MEVRVESATGYDVPPGCYVGVRVGDVLKQGRYEPQRCYHFPAIERRRNAKIDIYRHVGSCVIAVDPDAKSAHEVSVASSDPTVPEMRLKVNVQGSTVDAGKQREARTKAVKNQAKDYLTKFNIEEKLSDAVKALLKEQPADPTAFLCRFLKDAPSAAPSPVAAARSPLVTGGPSAYHQWCRRNINNGGRAAPAPSAAPTPLKAGGPSAYHQWCGRNKPAPSPSAEAPPLVTGGPSSYHQWCRRNLNDGGKAAPPPKATPTPLATGGPSASQQWCLKQAPPTSSSTKARPGQVLPLATEKEVQALRAQARNVLVKASENGGLKKALVDVQKQDPAKSFEKKASVGTWLAKPQGPKKVQTFSKMPSVGTWLQSPPPGGESEKSGLLMSNHLLMGPQVYSLGLQSNQVRVL